MNTTKNDISKAEAVSDLKVIINELLDITYISGYNDGLTDVLEYLHTAHGGDTYVSKAELIGHIKASIKNEGDLSDD